MWCSPDLYSSPHLILAVKTISDNFQFPVNFSYAMEIYIGYEYSPGNISPPEMIASIVNFSHFTLICHNLYLPLNKKLRSRKQLDPVKPQVDKMLRMSNLPSSKRSTHVHPLTHTILQVNLCPFVTPLILRHNWWRILCMAGRSA